MPRKKYTLDYIIEETRAYNPEVKKEDYYEKAKEMKIFIENEMTFVGNNVHDIPYCKIH